MKGARRWLLWATAVVPALAALKYLASAPSLAIFAIGAVAVGVLAVWMRRATEQIALHAGPAVGGLLNISFGSATELILALFVVASGHPDVVRAQIVGSIMGTTLLGLGLACLFGGWARTRQTFSEKRAGLLSTLLLLVVIAQALPAVFDRADISRGAVAAQRALSEHALSVGVSVVLLLLYAGNLAFTLFTHRDVFAGAEPEGESAAWSLWKALSVLATATVAVAFSAYLVSGALEASATALRLPLVFVGIVPLALIGTAADLMASVTFARQDRMDLVMTLSIGSAIQMGLVIAPLVVLISWAMGRPMSLVFPSVLDLFALAGAAFIVNAVATDGETHWFEGLLLVGVYVLLALAFFFIGPA